MTSQKTHKLVLIRHGQSQWNLENRFTGWKDVPLTQEGFAEALEAGKKLKDAGFEFDQIFTSVLRRALETAWTLLNEMDQLWVPQEKSWRLNERHYGNLQGLNKKETAEKYGDEQVFIWRRSYDTPPPAMPQDDERHAKHDRRYKGIDGIVPDSESLKTTLERVLPYWESTIAPQIKSGKNILIVAHGNSLRSLVKHLDSVSDEEITKLNIPTGVPLVYDLDENLKPVKSGYLE